jgi:hypothetical protein
MVSGAMGDACSVFGSTHPRAAVDHRCSLIAGRGMFSAVELEYEVNV